MLLGLSGLEDGQTFFFPSLQQAISSEARQNWPLIVGATRNLNKQALFLGQKDASCSAAWSPELMKGGGGETSENDPMEQEFVPAAAP